MKGLIGKDVFTLRVHWPILLLKSEHVLFPYAPTFETCKMNMSFIDILRLKTH